MDTGPFSRVPRPGFLVESYGEVNVDDLSYLGAELTIEIGQEHEKHTFNVPTAVSIPKGLPHFPIACDRVDRPYGVVQVGLSPKHEARWAD